MGPPSHTRFVVDRNVVKRRRTVYIASALLQAIRPYEPCKSRRGRVGVAVILRHPLQKRFDPRSKAHEYSVPTAVSGGMDFTFSTVQAMTIIPDLARTNLEIPDQFHIKTRPLVSAQWQCKATQREAACSFETVRLAEQITF
jgi:hypothetical protein